MSAWKKVQNDWKDPVRKKALIAKKKAELAKKQKEAAGDGEEAAAVKEEDAKLMEIDIDDLDADTVEDVTDVGSGEPLFSKFAYEDWTLLGLRYELHLLIHSFRKDLADPERTNFPEAHLTYYFKKYYDKQLNLKFYCCEKFADLVELLGDSIDLDGENKILVAKNEDGTALDKFIRYAEEHRKERTRRAEAGDETALLKFPRPQPTNPPRQDSRSQTQSSSHGGSRTGSGYDSRSSGRGHQDSQPQKRSGGYNDRGAPPPKSQRTGGGYSGSGGGGGGSYSGYRR